MKPKKRAIDGFLPLDKPGGMTSNVALQKVKRLYAAAKVGHTGSLDPMATGVLPLCFGRATRLAQFLLNADKEYVCTFLFGVKTATGDADGEEVERRGTPKLAEKEVRAALGKFCGVISQTPPMYSAVKVGGRPLYKLARRGLEVRRSAREVTISRFELHAFRPGEWAEADVLIACSKGTYVRTLAEDVAAHLGTVAHVKALRRTRTGACGEDEAVTLEALQALWREGDFSALDARLQAPERAVMHLESVLLPPARARYFMSRQPVKVDSPPRLVRVCAGETFLGVGEVDEVGLLFLRCGLAR